MVVVQLECLGVDWFVKRPGVRGVLLGQHLFEDDVAVFEVLGEPASLDSELTRFQVLQVLLGWFDGSPGALSPQRHFGLLAVGERGGRFAPAGRDGRGSGCGGVCFPLYPLLLGKRAHRNISA